MSSLVRFVLRVLRRRATTFNVHGRMNRLLQILAVAVAVMIVTALFLLIPRFRNMASEYGTAEAIQDLKQYVQQHDGRWPESASDLEGKYPTGGKVHVDYSVTSDRLIGDLAILRDAVRPRSGNFYTYPHYDEMIRELHAVLRKTNQASRKW